jgi:hypothetical protein
MSHINRSHDTKSVKMRLNNNSPRKQAGSNRLTLTVESTDWRIESQTVNMTIRDAKALQNFLNQHLS